MVRRPIIPALGRLRQEDMEFKASLSHGKTPSHKAKNKNKITTNNLNIQPHIGPSL
jgi:hypothetical protein